jgi:DNA repair exonuclease SbcCD ATPase subunit
MDHGIKESSIVEDTIGRYTELANKVSQNLSIISSNNNTITRLQKQVQSYQDELNKLSEKTGDLSNATSELKKLEDVKNGSNNERYEINETYTYNAAMAEMLKDTGIKTKVIKQYLPVINNLVNKYLQTLDFFVHFDLDESFQETIRSRHRDAFSYDSFSEGEKQRIDLALLFTWRMIAKMKNSVATNLLILDETFDSSLDHDGVDNLMKILYTLDDDTNVFVISHKGEILDGKFENKIEFFKKKNFSKMK